MVKENTKRGHRQCCPRYFRKRITGYRSEHQHRQAHFLVCLVPLPFSLWFHCTGLCHRQRQCKVRLSVQRYEKKEGKRKKGTPNNSHTTKRFTVSVSALQWDEQIYFSQDVRNRRPAEAFQLPTCPKTEWQSRFLSPKVQKQKGTVYGCQFLSSRVRHSGGNRVCHWGAAQKNKGDKVNSGSKRGGRANQLGAVSLKRRTLTPAASASSLGI